MTVGWVERNATSPPKEKLHHPSSQRKGFAMTKGSARASNTVLYTSALLFIFVFCIACFAIFFRPRPDPIITPTPTTSPTVLPTNTPPPPVTPSPTATYLPDVEVLKWHPVYTCRGKIAVEVSLVGVEVRGGLPPFRIEAHYKYGKALPIRFATDDLDLLTPYKLNIDPPLTFNTDKWVVVTLRSNMPNGLPEWSGELYYSPDAGKCNGN